MYVGLFQPLSPSDLIQVVGKYSEGREGSSDNDDSDDDEKQGVFEDSGSECDMEGDLPSDSLSSLSQSQSSLGTEFVSENQVNVYLKTVPALRENAMSAFFFQIEA